MAIKTIEDSQDASLASQNGWINLACAVLKDAAERAKKGDPYERAWLLESDDAPWFAEVAGVDWEQIRQVVTTWPSRPAGKIVIKVYT